MRKILFRTATAMFLFISCSDSATKSTDTVSATGESSQNEKNLANNRKVYKAIETGDMSTLDTLIASDAVDHQGPNGTDIKGTDSVKHMLANMHNLMKDMNMEIIADAANGDYIFTLAHFRGTVTDAYMGMPAGTKLDEKGVDLERIRDGKMVEHWGFADPNEMMKHMNAMPMNNKMKK